MTFLSSRTMRDLLERGFVVGDEYADPTRISCGAYHLSMGAQAYITSDGVRRQELAEGQPLRIPPGQFGVLLTQESVKIPKDMIGFISIRAKTKFSGLVNVSGFHVDPGWEGHLKFAVYNAGSRVVFLTRGQKVFLLWLARFDEPTDGYNGSSKHVASISSDDMMQIEGELASPAALKKQVDVLDNRIAHQEARIETLRYLLSGLLVAFVTIMLTIAVSFMAGRAGRGDISSASSLPASRSPSVDAAKWESQGNTVMPVGTENQGGARRDGAAGTRDAAVDGRRVVSDVEKSGQ